MQSIICGLSNGTMLITIRLYVNSKAYETCNFNCHFGSQGLLKVTDSHIQHEGSNISETAQDSNVVTIDH